MSTDKEIAEIRATVDAFNHLYDQGGGYKSDEFLHIETLLQSLDQQADYIKALEAEHDAADESGRVSSKWFSAHAAVEKLKPCGRP